MAPRPDEILVDVTRSGVNFADTHASRNDYLAEQTLPLPQEEDANPAIYEEMQATIATLRRVLADLQANPGRYIGEVRVF